MPFLVKLRPRAAVNSLVECQHHGLPADLSWWLHEHIVMCVCFFVRMWVVLPTAPGVIDPAEGTHNMGLFLSHARVLDTQHNISW